MTVKRLQEIIDRNNRRATELAARAQQLRTELEAIEKQVEESRLLAEDARTLLGAQPRSGEAVSSTRVTTQPAAPAATPSASSAPSPASSSAAPPAAATTAPAARKRGSVDDETIKEMGIVDAAIALAKRHNEEVADAGQVLSWFEEIGYESRTGLPSRNSVYVSLNRESKSDDGRIERHDRGQFKFNIK